MPDQRGQSTVELALCLPFVALVLAVVIEIGTLSVDRARLWHAAREAARVAAVTGDASAIEEAAMQDAPAGIEVSIQPEQRFRVTGEPVTVHVSYQPQGRIPLIGRALAGMTFEADVSMRIEEP